MEKIDGGVTYNKSQVNTIFSEMKIINEKLDNFKFKATKINPKELEDPLSGESNRKSVIKKLYRGNEVACKPNTTETESQKIQKQLVIFKKLKESPNILKFYGLSNLNDNHVMVFEWAEKGNLRELYNNNDIDWDDKIPIALDICRGLIFLHSCDILHHDIRCQNIMVNFITFIRSLSTYSMSIN
jgi:serine/threonine protein kinase